MGSSLTSPIRFPLAPLSEADLSALWEGQRFPPGALHSPALGTVRVIYRGRRTGGPGPDFRDAIIATSAELLQGDIELHVRSSDFRRHGHQRDPAYDALALHVVFEDDDGERTELASGRRVPVAALGDWAAARAAELRRRLAGPPLWREPCNTAVDRLGGEGAGAALDRLGEIRFRQKTARFARETLPRTCGGGETEGGTSPDQLVWAAVLEALGFGGQRELMRAVADHVPWPDLADTLAAVPPRRRAATAYRLLIAALDKAQLRVPLVLRPLRPGNRPETRLRGAAALAARHTVAGFLEALVPAIALAADGRRARLIEALVVPGAIGRGRAIELLVNAVLPAAAAVGVPGAEAAFRSLPRPAHYGAVRHIRAALAGAVQISARRQQGMLYLLKQYCTRGGCGRCPLS